MDFHAATWWERAARALQPAAERLAKLIRGREKRTTVKVRVRSDGNRFKSRRSRWSS